MSICHFCHGTADFVAIRRHPIHEWEVRVKVCEGCICNRLPALEDDDVIDERVVPIWDFPAVITFAPSKWPDVIVP